MVNDNLVNVVVTPGAEVGESAAIQLVPSTTFVTMDPQIETAAEGKTPRVEIRTEGPRRFSVRGRIPIGHKPIVKTYEIEEPASFARALFIEGLRKRGVRVSASPIAGNDGEKLPSKAEVAKLPKVAEYTSPPFKEYLRVILKVSHNLHASTLPLLVASKHGELTLEEGLKREGAFLKSVGIDIDSISFGGGAGGSCADLVSPRATVALLRAMAKCADFPSYSSALPILGRDGTLSKSIAADSPARPRPRQDGNLLRRRRAQRQKRFNQQGPRGLHRDRVRSIACVRVLPQQRPARRSRRRRTRQRGRSGCALGKLSEIFYLDKDEAPKAVDAATGR